MIFYLLQKSLSAVLALMAVELIVYWRWPQLWAPLALWRGKSRTIQLEPALAETVVVRRFEGAYRTAPGIALDEAVVPRASDLRSDGDVIVDLSNGLLFRPELRFGPAQHLSILRLTVHAAEHSVAFVTHWTPMFSISTALALPILAGLAWLGGKDPVILGGVAFIVYGMVSQYRKGRSWADETAPRVFRQYEEALQRRARTKGVT